MTKKFKGSVQIVNKKAFLKYFLLWMNVEPSKKVNFFFFLYEMKSLDKKIYISFDSNAFTKKN